MPVMRDTSPAVNTSSIAIVMVPVFPIRSPNLLPACWSGCEKRFVVFGSPGDALGDGAYEEFVPKRCVPVPGIDSVDEYVVAIAIGLVGSGAREKLPNKFLAIGALIGQGLAGPFSGYQHTASGKTERAAAVCPPLNSAFALGSPVVQGRHWHTGDLTDLGGGEHLGLVFVVVRHDRILSPSPGARKTR